MINVLFYRIVTLEICDVVCVAAYLDIHGVLEALSRGLLYFPCFVGYVGCLRIAVYVCNRNCPSLALLKCYRFANRNYSLIDRSIKKILNALKN